MKAIILTDFGSADQLKISEQPVPKIKDGEVLVQTKAISINPVDVQTRAGKGKASEFNNVRPIILGWDMAGTVTESASPSFKQGDAVFGMVNFPGRGNAYAEYVASPADHLSIKPENVSFDVAAATTLAALTAWQALHEYGHLKKGERILIHAASGGVGHFAVQLAKQAGAYVIGTSSLRNKDFVLSLGADEHMDYKAVRFEDAYHDIDFILDTVGQDYVARSIPVLRKGGTLITIFGRISDSDQQKAKEAGVMAANMLVRSNGDDMTQLAALLAGKKLQPHISAVYKFEDMTEAHLQLESHRTIGKVVVAMQ